MKTVWKKWLYPDSIIKKCFYGVAGAALIMLLLIQIFLKGFMFQLVKPELLNNFSVLTSAVSTKVSYVLHQNSQYLWNYWKDETLMDQAVSWAELEAAGEGEQEQAQNDYRSVLQKLKKEERGEGEPGAITTSREVFLAVDGEYLLADEAVEPSARRVMASEWFAGLPGMYQKLLENLELGDVVRCYSPVFPEDQDTEEFIAFALPGEIEGHQICLVMVEPFVDYRNIFADFAAANLTDYCLVGYDDVILYQNRPDSPIREILEGGTEVIPDGMQYETVVLERADDSFVLSARASYRMDQIRVVAGLKQADFLRQYQPFIQAVSVLFILFVLFLGALLLVILGKSLGQLRELAGQMKEVQDGRYEITERSCGNDEVGRLASAFYLMAREIRKNIAQIKEQEKREKRIEYSLLLSQIDPHFIYNTLNTVTFLAQMKETDDIIVLNKALIGMLQDRLRITRLQIFDTLEEEKKQIDSYMTIQSYLCRNPIDYQFDIPEECMQLRYPKNVLQPFVENAIIHGILLNKDEHGKLIPGIIRIRIRQENGEILTEVEDNGKGMEEEQIGRYFRETSGMTDMSADLEKKDYRQIGIYNIRMRLGYLYGDKEYMTAERSALGGLKICMRFPAGCPEEAEEAETET